LYRERAAFAAVIMLISRLICLLVVAVVTPGAE
jgi:hypothetical protein